MLDADFIIILPRLLFYTALSIITIYFLHTKVKKYEWIVLIVITYLCLKISLPYLTGLIHTFSQFIKQFQVVQGFNGAYADHMKYLYLEPLKSFIVFLVRVIVCYFPIVICFVYSHRLHINKQKGEEIKKMRIQDL